MFSLFRFLFAYVKLFPIMILSNRIHLVTFRPTRAAKREHVSNLTGPPGLEDRWLSVDEIAAYLGVKRDTVYKWIVRTSMPAHKVGRLWKFRKSEVDAWVCSKGTQTKRQQKKRN